MTATTERLEYLRGEINAERISWSELAELQGLAEHIDEGDVQLREWAGLPEREHAMRFSQDDEDFQAVHRSNIADYSDLRRKVQLGELLMATAEIREECPSVASFRVMESFHPGRVWPYRILNADDEPVSAEERNALTQIFHIRDLDDYTLFMDRPIRIDELADEWDRLNGETGKGDEK